MKKLLRPLIVFFWIALFFGTLYFPKWEFLKLDSKTISVFAWGDILEPSVIADFEKETGIKIHLNFYYSNEELAVKLKATGGEGYDMVVPSDYAVKVLSDEGLLKELDQEKLNFLDKLNPSLINHAFDPNNRYSVPFAWEIYGMGVDTEILTNITPSWDLVFKPISTYKITMINDPIEAISFASFYLYGQLSTLSSKEASSVKQLLTEQRAWVEAYTENRGDYFLATKNCPLVVTTSTYAARTMRTFPHVDFVLPKEGTFITVENFCIPRASNKEALVYQFMNYLYRNESIRKHYDTYFFYPAVNTPIAEFEKDPRMKTFVEASKYPQKKRHFLHKLLTPQQILELWVGVKS